MQENQLKINGEKMLKKIKKEAMETIQRVEGGLYDKVYNHRKKEIENFYSEENDEVAKNTALGLLEQIKEEDMAKYKKAKKFLERLLSEEELKILSS
jgi:carbamate kinase